MNFSISVDDPPYPPYDLAASGEISKNKIVSPKRQSEDGSSQRRQKQTHAVSSTRLRRGKPRRCSGATPIAKDLAFL